MTFEGADEFPIRRAPDPDASFDPRIAAGGEELRAVCAESDGVDIGAQVVEAMDDSLLADGPDFHLARPTRRREVHPGLDRQRQHRPPDRDLRRVANDRPGGGAGGGDRFPRLWTRRA